MMNDNHLTNCNLDRLVVDTQSRQSCDVSSRGNDGFEGLSRQWLSGLVSRLTVSTVDHGHYD
jgi:hypothetical protein